MAAIRTAPITRVQHQLPDRFFGQPEVDPSKSIPLGRFRARLGCAMVSTAYFGILTNGPILQLLA
jgi:hypothetical protein